MSSPGKEETTSQGRSAIELLLDRPLPGGYAEEWLDRVREEQVDEQTGDTVSVLLFRLGEEWMAIGVEHVAEVTTAVPVHKVPHRTNAVLKGVANIRGELQLAVSLKSLFGLKPEEGTATALSRKVYPRMIVIGHEQESFVFVADEVFGIHQLEKTDLAEVPVTLSKAMATFTGGIFNFRETQVGLLDGELIFHSLRTQYL